MIRDLLLSLTSSTWISLVGSISYCVSSDMDSTFVNDLVDGDLVGGIVVRQPGDHSCLYHSICFFLNRMYSTLSYTPLLLRSEIHSFIFNHRSSMLYLGPGSLYTVAECVLMEHYTIERYVSFMSKSFHGGVLLSSLVLFICILWISMSFNLT